MNRQETTNILSVLKANYPQTYKGWTREQSEMYVSLWSEAFKDDDVKLVISAVKAIIYSDTREFAPNIGQVKDKMNKLSKPPMMSEQEAWAKISKAIRNGIYGNVKEFNELPPVLQRIVGTPQQLYDWAIMDSHELQTVVASNIQRSYRQIAKHEQEMQALPLELKELFKIGTRDKNTGMLMIGEEIKK